VSDSSSKPRLGAALLGIAAVITAITGLTQALLPGGIPALFFADDSSVAEQPATAAADSKTGPEPTEAPEVTVAIEPTAAPIATATAEATSVAATATALPTSVPATATTEPTGVAGSATPPSTATPSPGEMTPAALGLTVEIASDLLLEEPTNWSVDDQVNFRVSVTLENALPTATSSVFHEYDSLRLDFLRTSLVDANGQPLAFDIEGCQRPTGLGLFCDFGSTAASYSYLVQFRASAPTGPIDEAWFRARLSLDEDGPGGLPPISAGPAESSVAILPTPTPEPTPTPPPVDGTPLPEPTGTPPPEVQGAIAGIDNTLISAAPAQVGEEIMFRIDVVLEGFPAETETTVLYNFDPSVMKYLRATTDAFELDACGLSAGAVKCEFGVASSDFSITLHFEGLAISEPPSNETAATLIVDFDGPGPSAGLVAGPAPADVGIIDVAGIQLPPLGDSPRAPPAEPRGVAPSDAEALRLRIPSLGIDAPILSLGLADGGAGAVPSDAASVGWYDFSSSPGGSGNAVLGGHLNWGGASGVFARLDELRVGDRIYLDGPDGTEVIYEVRASESVEAGLTFGSVLGARAGPSSITLLTCGGAFVPAEGEYDHRRAVYAVAVSP
jgi:LPXTG-site transpeptidase (sortase) family protein